MIAPTKIYKYVPTLSPEQAADLIAYAIVKRPKKVATNLGRLASITYSVAPDINNKLMSIGYNLFPSSSASVGEPQNSIGCKKHMHVYSQANIGKIAINESQS